MNFPALSIRKLGVAVIVGAALTLGLFGQIAMAAGPGPGGGGPGGGNGPGGNGGGLGSLPAGANPTTVVIPCSVSALATAITNANTGGPSILALASYCSYSISTPATVGDGLPIVTGVVILQGGLSTTITRSAGPAFRLLEVAATGSLMVRNITLTSGSTSGLGGAILNAGVLTVQSSTFTSNQGGNGGGISNSVTGTLVVTDSTFGNNKTTGVGGGAIINFGNMTLSNSHILSNTAPINGGGLNTQPAGVSTINNTDFRLNTSGGLGGAISNLGTTTINGGIVTLNKGSAGGGIATSNTNVTLNGTLVIGNTGAAPGANCTPPNTIVGCFD